MSGDVENLDDGEDEISWRGCDEAVGDSAARQHDIRRRSKVPAMRREVVGQDGCRRR